MCECLPSKSSKKKSGNIESGEQEAAAAPEIKSFLDGYVIGRTRQKKLAVAVSNPTENFPERQPATVELTKSNISADRTDRNRQDLLAATLSRMLEVPSPSWTLRR